MSSFLHDKKFNCIQISQTRSDDDANSIEFAISFPAHSRIFLRSRESAICIYSWPSLHLYLHWQKSSVLSHSIRRVGRWKRKVRSPSCVHEPSGTFSLKRSSCVCVCWSRPDRFYMAAFDRTEALWVIRSRGRFFPVYSCCSRVKTKRNKTKNCEIRNIKKGFSLSAWRKAFRPFHHVPPSRIGIEGAVWGVLVPHLRRQCHSIWFCNENERERERRM